MKSTDHFDVVLSGGGLSSYLCGALLTKAGKKTLLIDDTLNTNAEKSEITSLFEPDFSVFTGVSASSALGKTMDELGLKESLDFIPFEAVSQILTPEYRLAFWSNYEDTEYDLKREFKTENSSLVDSFKELYAAKKELKSNIEDVSLPIPLIQKKNINLKSQYFQNWGNALLGSLTYASPVNLNSEQWLRSLALLFQGTYSVKGGIEFLKKQLTHVIHTHGGMIKTGTQVESLTAKGKDISGVLLSSYEGVVFSDYVILTDRIRTLYATLPENVVQPSTQKILSKLDVHSWRFTIAVTVDSDVLPEGLTSNMTFVGDFQEPLIEENYLRIISHSIEGAFDHAHSFINEGTKTTLLVTALVPYLSSTLNYSYLRKLGGKMLRQLSSILPFLEDNILSIHPDIRKYEKEIKDLYPFHKLELIPQNLLQYYIRGGKNIQDFYGCGWSTSHPNLYFSGRTVWPCLGTYGEVLAARKIYEDIVRPKLM